MIDREELVERLQDAATELVDLVEDIRQGDYVPDSFTTQPMRVALSALKKPHNWNDVGERCLDCGDKDWFAGPECEGRGEQQAHSGDAELVAALEYFTDREAPIQSKFDLYGPRDLADSLRAGFGRARAALAPFREKQGGEA